MSQSQPSQTVSPKKFIFLFGAPGAGKGTYSGLLKKDLKLNHISTGDEIRKILKGQTSSTFDSTLKEEIRELVQAGKLVNDDIVINIIKEKLKEPESANGVILDGFPRTSSQFQKYQASGLPIDLVINVTLNESVLVEKLMGRRVCNICGATYNYCLISRDGYQMEPLYPKIKGICDKCGSNEIVIRADDTIEIINSRLKEYTQKTQPILSLFEQKGKTIYNFEPRKGINDYPILISHITRFLEKKGNL